MVTKTCSRLAHPLQMTSSRYTVYTCEPQLGHETSGKSPNVTHLQNNSGFRGNGFQIKSELYYHSIHYISQMGTYNYFQDYPSVTLTTVYLCGLSSALFCRTVISMLTSPFAKRSMRRVSSGANIKGPRPESAAPSGTRPPSQRLHT